MKLHHAVDTRNFLADGYYTVLRIPPQPEQLATLLWHFDSRASHHYDETTPYFEKGPVPGLQSQSY